MMVTQDPATIKTIAIVKGIFFILITAILLLSLLMKYAEELVNSFEDLSRSNSRLNHALIVSNQGFYELNLKTGEAVVSKCYWTMLGYESGDCKASTDWWEESLHPADRDHVIKTLEECRIGERTEYRIYYRLKTRSGEWKWIESAGQVVQYGSDNKPLILIGMHSDIDERKMALERTVL